jgi:DNA-binding transcriptional LysR family regulator
LLALRRGGSVAGAARLLGVDASTVSRRLAAVERAMGAVLVVRGGRNFEFTAEGKAALEAAAAIETALAAAAASVRASRADLEGVVRIAVAPAMVEFLTPLAGIVADEHPGLSVELGSSHAPIDLAKSEADIALRRQPGPDLIMRHSCELGLGVYASAAYLDGAGRPTRPEELSRHTLVLFTSELSHPSAAWIEQHAGPDTAITRVDNVESARSVIAGDNGIGLLWCCHGDPVPALERVFPDPISSVTFTVVYHRSLRGSARVKAVADLLTAYLVEHQKALSGRREAR